MPKMKTKKIARKRFKLTKNGKVTHRTQGMRHLRSKKGAAHKRRQDKSKTVTNKKVIQRITRLLRT
jgi:large subunit ribosomal protein L35